MNYATEYILCPVHKDWPLKDAGGCWKCYDEKRQESKLQDRAQATKARKLKQKIKPISSEKAHREAKLSKLRKQKKQATPYCMSCGTTSGPLDYSHILSVKQFPQYELHPDNGVIHCRSCHSRWENGSLQDKMKLGNWQQMLNFILKYEPAYFNKLQLKSIKI